MGWLTNLLGGSFLSSGNAILGRFFKDKDAAEANTDKEQQASSGELAAEFAPRADRTWWDSLVDGINRLPRPLIAFGAIGLMVWAPVDPVGFAETMQVYTLMPQWLALLIAQVILLFFGGRMISNWGSMSGPSADQVKAVLSNMAAIRKLGAPASDPPPPPPAGAEPEVDRQAANLAAAAPIESGAQFQADMADTSRPLPNRAILEWNRQQKAGLGPR